jgi:hypothetical protein
LPPNFPSAFSRAGRPRDFARIFREEIGETQARYIETQRVEATRWQLETTVSPLDEVADIWGFGSADYRSPQIFPQDRYHARKISLVFCTSMLVSLAAIVLEDAARALRRNPERFAL